MANPTTGIDTLIARLEHIQSASDAFWDRLASADSNVDDVRAHADAVQRELAVLEKEAQATLLEYVLIVPPGATPVSESDPSVLTLPRPGESSSTLIQVCAQTPDDAVVLAQFSRAGLFWPVFALER